MFKRRLALFIAILCQVWLLSAQAITMGTPLATVRLVKVDVVTEQEFRAEIAKREQLENRSYSQADKQTVLNAMIDNLLFLQMCERDGIRVTDAEIEQKITEVRSASPSPQQFEATLASQGVTLADLRTLYRRQLLLQRWITRTHAAEVAALPPVNAQDILSAYELRRAQLIRPDTVQIAFVFYEFTQHTEEERRAGAELMRNLAERLGTGSDSFDSLRLRASQGGYQADPTPLYVARSEQYLQALGQRFFDVVFSMQNNAVSAPFETDRGWWLVRRVDFYPQKQLELSDPLNLGQPGTVQDALAMQIAQQRQNTFLTRILGELSAQLRTQAEIRIVGRM